MNVIVIDVASLGVLNGNFFFFIEKAPLEQSG